MEFYSLNQRLSGDSLNLYDIDNNIETLNLDGYIMEKKQNVLMLRSNPTHCQFIMVHRLHTEEFACRREYTIT